MKQFNLETYNRLVAEGKTPKIMTRDGRSARILCTNRLGIHPVIALYSIIDGNDAIEEVGLHYADGSYDRDRPFPDDLFFADTEPTYRPYKDAEECVKDAVKHGGWVKSKFTKIYEQVANIDGDGVRYTDDVNETFQEMLNVSVWADDGSPCGVKEE